MKKLLIALCCFFPLCLYGEIPENATLEELKARVDKGDTEAMRALASRYDDTPGKEADVLALYQQAAEKGDVLAQYLLGFRYQQGIDVEKDTTVAAKWYQKAADQEDAAAQHELGGLYAILPRRCLLTNWIHRLRIHWVVYTLRVMALRKASPKPWNGI